MYPHGASQRPSVKIHFKHYLYNSPYLKIYCEQGDLIHTKHLNPIFNLIYQTNIEPPPLPQVQEKKLAAEIGDKAQQ